jgi:hypothetical protein
MNSDSRKRHAETIRNFTGERYGQVLGVSRRRLTMTTRVDSQLDTDSRHTVRTPSDQYACYL